MPGYNAPPQPQPQQAPRPPLWAEKTEGTTRLLIVGGAMAIVAYFGLPILKGDMTEIGRQLSGNHGGFPPAWNMRLDETQSDPIEDRRGDPLPRGRTVRPREDGGDLADQAGPPRWNESRGEAPRETSGRSPYRDGGGCPVDQLPYPEGCRFPRWKECTGRGDHLRCSEWLDGPAPEGRRRW